MGFGSPVWNVFVYGCRRLRCSKTGWLWPAHGQIEFSMHLLFFERGKEAFHDGIIPAVDFAAHAAQDVALQKPLLIIVCGILAAA